MRGSVFLGAMLGACLALGGCGDDGGPDDGGGVDGGGGDSGGVDGGGVDATGTDAAGTDGGGTDAAGDDGGGTDAAGTDAAGVDAAGTDAAGADAAGVDAGMCTATDPPMCSSGTMCLCCPAGGPRENCLCTTRCATDDDCMDAARPLCNRPMMGMGEGGICTPAEFTCRWGTICAAPDTPIATPDGERPIAQLREGDLVYSVDHDQLVPVPVVRASRTAVQGHHSVRVRLSSGRELLISAGHPTADGRTFGDLSTGTLLDGVEVLSAELVPYPFDATYDILPASDTGAYVAGGVLIGSTLGP